MSTEHLEGFTLENHIELGFLGHALEAAQKGRLTIILDLTFWQPEHTWMLAPELLRLGCI